MSDFRLYLTCGLVVLFHAVGALVIVAAWRARRRAYDKEWAAQKGGA